MYGVKRAKAFNKAEERFAEMCTFSPKINQKFPRKKFDYAYHISKVMMSQSVEFPIGNEEDKETATFTPEAAVNITRAVTAEKTKGPYKGKSSYLTDVKSRYFRQNVMKAAQSLKDKVAAKLNKMKTEQTKEEEKECTFKPKVNSVPAVIYAPNKIPVRGLDMFYNNRLHARRLSESAAEREKKAFNWGESYNPKRKTTKPVPFKLSSSPKGKKK